MQIVIEITEETYRYMQSRFMYQSKDESNSSIFEKAGVAIKNGIPLPKGHGDLIDVSRKITVSTYDEQYEEWGEKTMTVLDVLNKWSDEGVRLEDVIIPGDKEGENDYD